MKAQSRLAVEKAPAHAPGSSVVFARAPFETFFPIHHQRVFSIKFPSPILFIGPTDTNISRSTDTVTHLALSTSPAENETCRSLVFVCFSGARLDFQR